jgi:hypothetical protein
MNKLILFSIFLVSCDISYKDPRAWSIVRQSYLRNDGMTNFGFITISGAVVAGFTNIEDAKKALKDYKYFYNKRIEEKKIKLFEVVK